MAIHQNPPTVRTTAASEPLLAAAMSNQDFAPYVPRPASQEWNLPAAVCEGTNLGDSILSNRTGAFRRLTSRP